MPPKRMRRASPAPAGLSAGERLKRTKLAGSHSYSAWGWVGTEVTDALDITQEHLLATCGFSKNSPHPLCANKYAVCPKVEAPRRKSQKAQEPKAEGELEDDVIVISDDDAPSCSNKGCKSNPYCLNYLGQEKWENEDKARQAFIKAADLGENPVVYSRDPGFPVGLKNLGATCYANAFLQVWFQDLPFRSGVYKCQPTQDAEHKFEESPIFQLQVTFAAMQQGVESAFNPVKLVESLKLRTTEQQDAQEFSKLFMAHLDTEFHKQSSPELQSLVAYQFQGKQVYGTICANCHRRSERDSDFHEIEVNIKNNATLEDRIAALLQPETLSGDNKYFCQRCDSLQDAQRYTELRELPPVLHFSLLRFVYDVSSMERKKSKHALSFPMEIDMDQFLGSAEARKKCEKDGQRKSHNLYQLRGVLLHKGSSAYHGHYEAQVFDVENQAWYQFNDETVTKIESLGAKGNAGAKDTRDTTAEKDGKKKSSVRAQKQRGNPRKRQRVESDSDIEILELSLSPASTDTSAAEVTTYISSKDAYMLVYSRVDHSEIVRPFATSQVAHNSQQNGSRHLRRISLVPPTRALEAVEALNAAHEKACEDFVEKENQAKARFIETRRKVMDIYRSWNLSSRDEISAVVSCQALESWIARHPAARMTSSADSAEKTAGNSNSASDGDFSEKQTLSVSGIMCPHGRLNPDRASDMKLITEVAYQRIISEGDCQIVPKLSPFDVCGDCVKDSFSERLYQIDHPRLVFCFDEIALVGDNEPGYWISKPWLKDWRLAKPKMHVASQQDPPPDAEQYLHHVRCPHGGLSTNTTCRRRISREAYLLLKKFLFPAWETMSTDTELCPVCEALIHISKEDKREVRKQAEQEKAKLRHMHDNALNGNTALLENVPCAIIPAHFVRSWRQWLLRPAEVPRPDSVDNSQFICEHGLLSLDPNAGTDLDSSVAIVKRSDWKVLEDIYSGGPLIAVENTGSKLVHEIPVCETCRRKRKSTFEVTEITVRILGPNDASLAADSGNSVQQARHPSDTPALLTYGSRNTGGLRQSNRIRQVKEQDKRRRVTITKTMTVKDLKIMFQDEFDIPTISQRLFYNGEELEDSAATVLSLGIMSNDVLDLREQNEDNNLFSDSDVEDIKPKRKNEGRGFGGTLLGGLSNSQSVRDPSSPSDALVPTFKSCTACTFENAVDAPTCTICDTPFTSQG
ncbi:hypothetical protein AcV5_006190 [Taiwanofungus camphoratus]|nr:hypothetical protein AcV5_006190 [Antrodia cinnamomea]